MPKSWLKQEPLPFFITNKPTQKNVVHWFDEGGGVTDEEFRLVLAAKGISVWAIAMLIPAFLMLIIMTVGTIFSKNVDFDMSYVWSVSALFIIAFVFWLFSFLRPTKRLILNRVTGKMTYPSYGFAPHLTITFKRATVYRAIVAGPDAMIMGAKLQARNPYDRSATRGTYDLAPSDPEEWWSYFVWYMDKNRPLPPGKSFDPYRQKDFERRKAEGFPRPLYPSNIPTPEATPEQQVERRKTGGGSNRINFMEENSDLIIVILAVFLLCASILSGVILLDSTWDNKTKVAASMFFVVSVILLIFCVISITKSELGHRKEILELILKADNPLLEYKYEIDEWKKYSIIILNYEITKYLKVFSWFFVISSAVLIIFSFVDRSVFLVFLCIYLSIFSIWSSQGIVKFKNLKNAYLNYKTPLIILEHNGIAVNNILTHPFSFLGRLYKIEIVALKSINCIKIKSFKRTNNGGGYFRTSFIPIPEKEKNTVKRTVKNLQINCNELF